MKVNVELEKMARIILATLGAQMYNRIDRVQKRVPFRKPLSPVALTRDTFLPTRHCAALAYCVNEGCLPIASFPVE